jgi:hypothetical protein
MADIQGCLVCFDHYMWQLSDQEFGCWDQAKENYCNADRHTLQGLPQGKIASAKFNSQEDIPFETPKFAPLQRVASRTVEPPTEAKVERIAVKDGEKEVKQAPAPPTPAPHMLQEGSETRTCPFYGRNDNNDNAACAVLQAKIDEKCHDLKGLAGKHVCSKECTRRMTTDMSLCSYQAKCPILWR